MKVGLRSSLNQQAALTELFVMPNPVPLWVALQLSLAAITVAVGFSLTRLAAHARRAIVGLEAVAVLIGVAGLTQHHYVPGTIIGLHILFTVLNHGQGPVGAGYAPTPGPASTGVNAPAPAASLQADTGVSDWPAAAPAAPQTAAEAAPTVLGNEKRGVPTVSPPAPHTAISVTADQGSQQSDAGTVPPPPPDTTTPKLPTAIPTPTILPRF